MISASDQQEFHFRIFVFVWMLFSIWSVVLQIFLQERIVKITSWNLSRGWQREIGLWNVGAIALIALHLCLQLPVTPILVPILLLWSALFGMNHLLAFLRSRQSHGHLSGFLMNLLPFLWAGAIFLLVQ